MAEEKEAPKRVSRKDFVKGAAAVAGVGALASCAPAAIPVPAETAAPCPTCPPAEECPPCTVPGVPETWDKEADVVIVGYGGAGAAAALEAHDAGAIVLILEKSPGGGGSTAMSGGFFGVAKAPLDLHGIVEYLIACGQGRVDEEMATAWAEEAVNLPDWVKGLGGAINVGIASGYHARYTGADAIESWGPAGGGPELFGIFSDAVEAAEIEVLTETPVKELVTGAEGEVLGVLADSGGADVYVKANRGVILTCGGLDYNESMKLHNLRAYPKYSVGHPGNTGDAITMAEKAGAALWKMSEVCGNLAHKFPDEEIAWPSMLQLGIAGLPAIIVNKAGKRFTNEAMTYDAVHKALDEFDPVNDEYPAIPCYGIFDETARLAAPVGYGRGWSADNSAEVEKGWILTADTIGELAGKIGVDAATLEATVQQYNGYCAAGEDPDFGREGMQPIVAPPYYAVETYPGIWGTWGGPKINTQAQVLDTYDGVIARLYAAGNASVGAFGGYYPIGGGCIGDAFAFGRIAGRNAAAEEPWE